MKRECHREELGLVVKNIDGTFCAEKNMCTHSTKAVFYTAFKSLHMNVKKGFVLSQFGLSYLIRALTIFIVFLFLPQVF